MDNPFKPHMDAINEKIAREREEEGTVTFKRRHLTKLRSLIFPGICAKGEDLAELRELDQIIYEALQRMY